MIDNEPDIGKKKRKLALTEKFVGELFADRNSDYDVKTTVPRNEPYVNWAQYRSELSNEELSCFRAMSRISFYLPRKPFYELLEGYRWDLDGKSVENETDLLLYSSYVAGSVGTLCVYVMMYKSGVQYDVNSIDNYEFMIEKAQQMGQVNINYNTAVSMRKPINNKI